MKVGVVGASGYVGGELVRLLLQHPKVELTVATSKRHEGEYLFRVHPGLRGISDMRFAGYDAEKVKSAADVVFTALPHGESTRFVPELAEGGLRVIDMSADFRLKDAEAYKTWYGYTHPATELLDRFVYAIPELNRDRIRQTRLAASPGCMAITTILAIAPLLMDHSLGLDAEHVVVDVKVGSSGSGGKPSTSTHFSERFGVVRPYKATGHRHSAEIEQALAEFSGTNTRISMSAHAVNMVRGILSTCHLFVDEVPESVALWKAYRKAYEGSFFVRLVRDKEGPFRLPDPKMLVGSNFCDVGFELETRTLRIVALGATDNLMKGAAGNAVQTMNLMCGFEESEGLRYAPLHPV